MSNEIVNTVSDVKVWCVGICFGNKKHTYKVFDDLDEAYTYYFKVEKKMITHHKIIKVKIWEM